jgi:hypothetical protein
MKAVDDSFDVYVPDAFNLIGNLDVPLTTYCSLHCKYCSHCIPAANPPKHFKAEEIINDLEKVLAHAYVECLAIMGGEPFVYPEITSFIRQYKLLKHKDNIGYTRVVTNGTMVPSNDFFEAYAEVENAYIYISNYGEKSNKIDELIHKCREYGIKTYICPIMNSWTSLGPYHYKRDYTEPELKHLFSVCTAHFCVQMLNGRIYSCPRIPVLNEDGLIPFCEDDYCEIRRADEKEIEDKLHQYLYEKPYLEGCRYCDGQHCYSKEISRGE